MKRIYIISLTIFVLCGLSGKSQNLLSSKYPIVELEKIVIPRSEWIPFPKLDDRDAWLKADQPMLKSYYIEALNYLTYQWPSIPATTTLLFKDTGNRSEYEGLSFKKRNVLGTLLLGEIYENKGRFLRQIIDGVWSICEESYWGVNSTVGQWHAGIGLPDVSDPYVDLFVAETASYLSWVDYFLGEKLDSISPQIRKRIYFETNNRFFIPFMNNDLSWMGFKNSGRRPNNWNPWICSNWLNAALLLEKNESRRVLMVDRSLKILDNFLSPYPKDGGCDEGPNYWNVAAGSLFDNLVFLNLTTNNAFQYTFDDEKVKNMGRFVFRTQISEKYSLNFADASPKLSVNGNMIWRYGKAIGDEKMQQFGSFYRSVPNGTVGRFQFFRIFFELFDNQKFEKAPKGLALPKEVWLPDLQVMVARDKEGSTNGFFVAAKGGNNDESHNHNDIGNYVVYYNGLPLLIDVGSGTYTARTFNSHRYDIWSNCSHFHNLPTINGVNQSPGANFKALDATFVSNQSFAQLSLDISHAYSQSAGVTKWLRTVRLNRGKNVEVTDLVTLSKTGQLVQHLMTCYAAEVIKPGELVIHFDCLDGKNKDFIFEYNPTKFIVEVEKIKLEAPEDSGIRLNWGETIHRINLTTKSLKTNEKFRFSISEK